MAQRNLKLRDGTYCWRRKITVSGHAIAISLSLRTGSYTRSRAIAERLAVELESLRMAYGERSTAIEAATLKKIFNDAMRWQLERILSDQIASPALVEGHRAINKLYGELWRLYARGGPEARYTADDDDRLKSEGWSVAERMELASLWESARRGEARISIRQTDAYADRFGFEQTTTNLDRVRRTIYGARALACDEATKRLGKDNGDFSNWLGDALADNSPFVFDLNEVPEADALPKPVPPSKAAATSEQPIGQVPSEAASEALRQPGSTAATERPKMLLVTAAEECIAAYVALDSWSADTCSQVATAIRLFDYACGGGIAVEDIVQAHVTAFVDLCASLPNRWGRTAEEVRGGLSASVERARTMDPAKVGMSQATIAKHITWITQVLAYVAGDNGEGHQPTVPISFARAKKSIGKRSGKTRTRDKRAAWTPQEIGRLLEAPIWSGCRDLDRRFVPGDEIFHDAWYWLPLMLIIYGSRSAELVGLPMSDVHEDATIPYFNIDYSPERSLKNPQSVRALPIHPELERLGFIEYVREIRKLGHRMLFPEMNSSRSKSFATTFHRSIFQHWRNWAFPNGTSWKHTDKGIVKDKDVHSFRGAAASRMKGQTSDSVRMDVFGHEGTTELQITYDEEASLELKLTALTAGPSLTASLQRFDLRLRPADRQKFGAKLGRLPDA